MAIKYFTWVPFRWNNGKVHVSALNDNFKDYVVMTELGYSGDDGAGVRHLGVAEGVFNANFTNKVKPRLLRQSAGFDIELISTVELQALLDLWYGAGMVVLNADGSFTDNRPEPTT